MRSSTGREGLGTRPSDGPRPWKSGGWSQDSSAMGHQEKNCQARAVQQQLADWQRQCQHRQQEEKKEEKKQQMSW